MRFGIGDAATVCEIGDGWREIEGMMPDSMISPLAIQDGSDMPVGVLCGYRAIHTRRGGTRAGRTAQAAERARQGSASVFARTSTICPAGRRSGVVPCAAQSRPPVSRPHGARPRQPRRRESASRDRTAAGAQRARQPLPDEEARTALAGLGQEMRAAGLPRGCRIEEGKTPISADCAGLGRGRGCACPGWRREGGRGRGPKGAPRRLAAGADPTARVYRTRGPRTRGLARALGRRVRKVGAGAGAAPPTAAVGQGAGAGAAPPTAAVGQGAGAGAAASRDRAGRRRPSRA